MLEEILRYIHNYFNGDFVTGTYSITGGKLGGCSLHFYDGQRVLIDGSTFWDGVWTWHETGPLCDSDDLQVEAPRDETFSGEITAMRVPKAVLKLAKEIKDWEEKNGDSMRSPYRSEKFGSYSYEKVSSAINVRELWQGWQQVFAKQLDAYRKLG